MGSQEDLLTMSPLVLSPIANNSLTRIGSIACCSSLIARIQASPSSTCAGDEAIAEAPGTRNVHARAVANVLSHRDYRLARDRIILRNVPRATSFSSCSVRG